MQRTTDISDELHPKVQYLQPGYCVFGAKKSFSGEIVTIKCFEDNSWVRKILAGNGEGKVLVVDAGGSMRCAMFGDQLAALAMSNAWQGVVMYGLIRDTDVINQMQIGVRALGTHPLKSVKNNVGETGVTVKFSGVNFNPGDYLYADLDGVIVVKEKIKC